MMTVQEAIDTLNEIPEHQRNLPLICIDSRSGSTDFAFISKSIKDILDEPYEMGVLCDADALGIVKFVPVYFG